MENRSRNHRRAASRAARTGGKSAGVKPAQPRAANAACAKAEITEKATVPVGAQGRLDHGPAIAVIDIGSNSVRLVVYEGLTRSPTPIFNEKVLAGLGREVQSTGLLAPDAVAKALPGAARFRALCDTLAGRPGVRDRDRRLPRCRTTARLSSQEAERICGIKIDVLSGKREARIVGARRGVGRLSSRTASPAISAAARWN